MAGPARAARAAECASARLPAELVGPLGGAPLGARRSESPKASRARWRQGAHVDASPCLGWAFACMCRCRPHGYAQILWISLLSPRMVETQQCLCETESLSLRGPTDEENRQRTGLRDRAARAGAPAGGCRQAAGAHRQGGAQARAQAPEGGQARSEARAQTGGRGTQGLEARAPCPPEGGPGARRGSSAAAARAGSPARTAPRLAPPQGEAAYPPRGNGPKTSPGA
jgi:hypothetical protein